MHLTATPTQPRDIPPTAMIDIPALPDEYATLIDSHPTKKGVCMIVLHKDQLHALELPAGEPVNVISYAPSNMLETT